MRPTPVRDIRLWSVALVAGALGLVFAAGCRGRHAGSLTLAGSTSVQPIAELLAEHYMAAHPGTVINVQGGGSSAGIQAAVSGAADIGMSSRHLKPDETGLQEVLLARDAIALIVHPRNPVRALAGQQVRGIFAGVIRRWDEVGGEPADITFITREEGSGTRSAFEDLLMKGEEISQDAIVQDSTGAARAIVAGDPHAVAYISLGMATPDVAVMTLDGVRPTPALVRGGQYRLTRPFLLLTRGAPTEQAAAFLRYVLSPEAQGTIAEEGYVPVQEGNGRP